MYCPLSAVVRALFSECAEGTVLYRHSEYYTVLRTALFSVIASKFAYYLGVDDVGVLLDLQDSHTAA